MADVPWIARGPSLVLSVRLTPKSARDEIGGLERLADGRTVLKVRVRALPHEGEANQALIRLLAKRLRLPAGAIRLEAGASSRLKTLVLTGDFEALAAELARLSASG